MKKDVQTRVAERLLERRARLAERIHERAPLGLGKVEYSQTEFRKRMRNAKAGEQQAFIDQLGGGLEAVETFLDMMEGADGGTPA